MDQRQSRKTTAPHPLLIISFLSQIQSALVMENSCKNSHQQKTQMVNTAG